MASYPPIIGGNVALYPVTRHIRQRTEVREALSGAEQRWNTAKALNSFILEYADLSAAERDQVQAFRDVVKDGFDSTWDITLGGVLYQACAFTENRQFTYDERTAEQWDFRIRFRQTAQSGIPTVSPPASFPGLEAGILTARPWSYSRPYVNSIVEMPSGKRYAYTHRATPRLGWRVGGESLSDTSATALLEFFVGAKAARNTFSFTDPETGTAHPKCRIVGDRFELRHVGPNENSSYLEIVAVL